MDKLTPRQWRLYNYLKARGDQWTTQAEIARDMFAKHGDYAHIIYDGEDFHNKAARYLMTDDIRKINDSGVIQKIIISSGRGIKLANDEEFDLYIRKEIAASVRRLLRAKRKAEKGKRDGQFKITFGEYEREVIEAFIPAGK